MIVDPISDMLTRIRNANALKRESVTLPSSKMLYSIASIMKKEGYIADCSIEEEEGKKNLKITLKYGPRGEKVITDLKRISKPGLRVTCGVENLPHVPGYGIAIISTSKGILTDAECRKAGVGGEVLCYVY